MQEITTGVQPLSKEQLMSSMKTELDQVILKYLDQDQDLERLMLINRAKRNLHFILGNQFIAPQWNGDVAEYVPVDLPASDDFDKTDVKFSYPFNVVGSDCWKYISVAGNRAPNTQAVPDDEDDPDSVSASQDADVSVRDLHRVFKLDDKVKTIAYHQWGTGPVFLYTPYVADRNKYGTTVEPQVGVEDQTIQPSGFVCPTCGSVSQAPRCDSCGADLDQTTFQPEVTAPAPVVTGQKEFANGDAEMHILTVLHVTIPTKVAELEDCLWLRYEYMEHKAKLLQAYPEKLDKLRLEDTHDGTMTGSQVASAEAIDSVANPSGIGRPRRLHYWRYARYWFQPAMYEMFTEAKLREQLKLMYPDGCKVTYVGDDFIDIEGEKLTDVWAVVKTGRGEYILSNALVADLIPLQRALNDFFNLAIETILRAIPRTVVDSGLLDRHAVANNDGLPAEVIFSKVPMSGDLQKMMATLPTARFSDQLMPFGELIRAFMREIGGIMESLFGGGAPTMTWRDAKQRKDQAMMQLSVPFGFIQRGLEKALENATKMRSRYGFGQIKAKSREQAVIGGSVYDRTNMENIPLEGWHCEAEEGIPITQSELTDRLMGLLQMQVPQIQQYLADPINAEQFFRLMGIRGWESPLANMRRKVDLLIEQLVSAPSTTDFDPLTGATIEMPSVMPDPLVDDIPMIAQMMREWCSTKRGLRLQQMDPQAFNNVRLFLQACQQLMAPPMLPPGPEGPGAPPPEKPAENPPPAPGEVSEQPVQ